MVPKRLTAENGAKGVLFGEFSETTFISCPECFGDDDCETCDCSGRIEIKVPVSWTTIKTIWAKGCEHFSIVAPAARWVMKTSIYNLKALKIAYRSKEIYVKYYYISMCYNYPVHKMGRHKMFKRCITKCGSTPDIHAFINEDGKLVVERSGHFISKQLIITSPAEMAGNG